MTEDELKRLLDATGQIPVPAEARIAAREAALAAFDETVANSQGNVVPLRLTPDQTTTGRSWKMNMVMQRWMLSGLASAAVLVTGVLLLTPILVDPPLGPPVTHTASDLEVPVVEPDRQPYVLRERQDQDQAKREVEDAIVARQRSAFRADETVQFAPQAARPAPSMRDEAVRLVPGGAMQAGRDQFESVARNPVALVTESPVSTFSVDVDTASYAFVRRQLNQGVLPQKDAVRLEEMVNYFDYDYTGPTNAAEPFEANVMVMDSPWKAGNKLVHIGIKGYDIPATQTPRSNLVLLLDVSGSMNAPDKLPLLKQSMALLLSQLRADDTVAIVTYAGASGIALEPTPVADKHKIIATLDQLGAGGSTAGGAGIRQAYQLAESSFVRDGVNRVILATDGDFNVGITDRQALKGFIERKRESGIYLSVLGFGQGNYNDRLMQALAQNGNGVAAYIDTLAEAQKVLIDEATSTLFPIAKDVKIQVEFNPATVQEYRLLGYETRMLKREDFNNDAVDAGDIGSGHTVTAIYEMTPVGASSGLIEPPRYGASQAAPDSSKAEYGFVKIRYKLPDETESRLVSQPIAIAQEVNEALAQEAQFAAAVAGFAQLLQGGQYTPGWSYDDAFELAQANKGADKYGYRAEFTQLIRRAKMAAALPD